MKRSLLLFFFCCSFFITRAQDASADILKRVQQVPSFTIYTAPDSTAFTNEQLQKGKPLIVIFFNPDCDHCQKETKELLAYKEELKNIPIVMASALPYRLIKDFYTEYNIQSMPNIKMGQDLNYILGSQYQPTRYPGIFIYDAAGNLVKVFAGNAGVPAMLDALK
ncbi:MAG: redoxin family protein [Ferruginibacter sp.]